MYSKNRRDRERLEHVQALAAEARARAERTTDPREREAQSAAARRMDHIYRTERSFPIGVWLWSVGSFLVLAPWALLARQHHPMPGLMLSAVVLIALLVLEVRSRRRRVHRRSGTPDG